MSTEAYERLGFRSSLASLLWLSISVALGCMLIAWVWALVTVGQPDSPMMWTVAFDGVVQTGQGIARSIDDLAAVIVTVLLGFYVAIIGGQFSPGLDVVALRRKLSSSALVLAVVFFCLSLLSMTAGDASGRPGGSVLVRIVEMVIVSGLAVELTSWVLLSRRLQVEQNTAALDRANARLLAIGGRLQGSARRRTWLVVTSAVVLPSVPVFVVSAASGRSSWSLFGALLLATALSQAAFGLVHWSRIAGLSRSAQWTSSAVPVFVGVWAVVAAALLASTGHPGQGIATVLTFAGPLVANVFRIEGSPHLPLTLRSFVERVEYDDAALSRRRSMQRLAVLNAPSDEDADDSSRLLDWLRRTPTDR